LTSGKDDRGPVCSADEKWVYYWDADLQHLVRAPLNGGGKAEPIPGGTVPRSIPMSNELSRSADGKQLAYVLATVPTPEDPYPQYKVALLDLSEKPNPPRTIEADERISSGNLSFTPDGKAVAYPIRENGVDNIWVQPLDGSTGHQITSFDSEQILNFRWSPDSRSICLLRAHTDSDVVLIRNASK
jgi:eukaryotic-like serine/threonine-protein kinase